MRQLSEHLESQDLQYQLQQRALNLGWRREQVVVIDEDLGKSAISSAQRSGFQTLMADVALGVVGGPGLPLHASWRPPAWQHASSAQTDRLHPVQMLRPLQAALPSRRCRAHSCRGTPSRRFCRSLTRDQGVSAHRKTGANIRPSRRLKDVGEFATSSSLRP